MSLPVEPWILNLCSLPNTDEKCYLVITRCNDSYAITMPQRNEVKLQDHQRINISYSGDSFTAQLFERNVSQACYAANTPEAALAGLMKICDKYFYDYWFIRYRKSFRVYCSPKDFFKNADDVVNKNCGATFARKLAPTDHLIQVYYQSEPNQ